MDRRQFIKKAIGGDYKIILYWIFLITVIVIVSSAAFQNFLNDSTSLLRLIGWLLIFVLPFIVAILIIYYLTVQLLKLLPGTIILFLRKNSLWIDIFLSGILMIFVWYKFYPKSTFFCIIWSAYMIVKLTSRIIRARQKLQL